MKLKCPDCKEVVSANGNGAVRCPHCGFTAKAPRKAPAPKVVPKPKPAQNSATPTQPVQPDATAGRPQTNGLAIAALVCGILGVCGAFPIAIAALVLGFIGLGQIKDRGEEGEGLAIAGIVMGAFGLLWPLFWWSSFFWWF